MRPSLFPLILALWMAGEVGAQRFHKYREVWIDQGLIQGRIWKFGQKSAQIFRGIPYAEPPVDDLRLRKPVKKKTWHGTLKTLEYGPPCIQFMDYHVKDLYASENMKKQSEDCLYLNVMAPYSGDESRLYPVLVWIHGGSFLAGSGDTSIDREVTIRNLVFRGVVVVTINYRLGPLGFLAYRGEEGLYKGNWGLWDQVMALEWIRENIRTFSGDPEKVTVMGESAGAASVSILALSPVTKDLVHAAIIMSGSGAAGWAVNRQKTTEWDVEKIVDYMTCRENFDKKEIETVKKHFAIETSDSGVCNFLEEEIPCDAKTPLGKMDCVREKLDWTKDNLFRKMITMQLSVSKAVVDGELIPFPMNEMLQNLTRVPILTGVAKNEWAHKRTIYYGFKSFTELNETRTKKSVRDIIDNKFKKTMDSQLANTTISLISNASHFHYVDSQAECKPWNVSAFVKQLKQMEADIEFNAPMMREAEAYASQGHPVFIYLFDHVPKSSVEEEELRHFNFFGKSQLVSFVKRMEFDEAFHGLDHAYIFTHGYANNFKFEFTKSEAKLSHILCRMISNFVKYHKPTPSPVFGADWPAYDHEDPRYLRIKLPPTVSRGQPRAAHVTFWNEHVPYLTNFATLDDWTAARNAPLSTDERLQLAAYKRAWWALWILVAAIAILLWTLVICMVATKCLSPRSKRFDRQVIVSKNR